MEMTRLDQDDMTRRVYEAALNGCIPSLNTLFQRDQLILNKISLTSYTETPLHISSLLGHLDFTKVILEKCPKMALELDSFKRSPLHLASAEGHTEVVKALLRVMNEDHCLVRDQDGRIPLHLASMRGRIEVIQALINACPASIWELLDGDSVLHLCVKYNHLEALIVLVENIKDDEVLNMGNQDGNTILHIACFLKQLETIKFILSLPITKVNIRNRMGLTAMDVIDNSPKDFKSLEIQEILKQYGAEKATIPTPTPTSKNPIQINPPTISTIHIKSPSLPKLWFNKFIKYMESPGNKNWIEETQGTLMAVATLIAAMTFQAVISPPGGLWQQEYRNGEGSSSCNKNVCVAGTAVFGYIYESDYRNFLISNSIAFVGSVLVVFLIISGFPVHNRFFVWIMTAVMSTTVFFSAYAYAISLDMGTPDSVLRKINWVYVYPTWIISWLALIGVVSLSHIIRLFVWINKMVGSWRNRRKQFRLQQLINGDEHVNV